MKFVVVFFVLSLCALAVSGVTTASTSTSSTTGASSPTTPQPTTTTPQPASTTAQPMTATSPPNNGTTTSPNSIKGTFKGFLMKLLHGIQTQAEVMGKLSEGIGEQADMANMAADEATRDIK